MNCKVCDKHFTGLDNYKQHEVSEKHKKKMMLYLQNNGTSNNSFSTSSQVSCEPLAGNINIFPCEICSKTFYLLSDFMQHSVSEDHANMVLNKRSEISMIEKGAVCSSTTEGFPTNRCGKDIPDSVSQVNKDSDLLNQSVSVNPYYYTRCDICDKSFSGLCNYEQHIVSSGHRKKCGLLTQDQKVIANNIISPNVCDKTFNNSSRFQQDMETTDCMRMNLAESSSIKVNSNNNSSINMNSLICEICNMTFTGPIPHNQHMESDSHKRGVIKKQLLNQMDIGKENEKTETTVDSVTKTSGISFSRPWYCETCNKICSGPEPYRAHIVSEKHKKNAAKAGAEYNQTKIRNIMSQPSGEVDIFSTQRSATADFNMLEDDSVRYASIKPDKEVKDSFLSETSTCAVDISQLNMTFFKVGEEIDFDKNEKSVINVSEMEINGMDDDDEETSYDDMPSP